ncbi:MAG TPA: radical SAM protein [Gammaproteobacteria bacterium]|nr:radical SAM protein [Gammaproteobacteria bacterium]
MVDVLLAHAFFLDNDTKQREEKFRPYSPLATLYAAAILRESGLTVDLFDATLQKENGDAFDQFLDKRTPRLLAIYEDSFNFLSKMCLTHVREATFRMIRSANTRSIPVIVSSSDASDEPLQYLSTGAKYVMLGEAENTIVEVVFHLLEDSPADAGKIAGIAFMDRDHPDQVLLTERRPTERKPDRFPWPARDLLDIDAYRSAWKNTHGRFSMNMVTTRGCPYACTWCAKPIWGKNYAVRSPEQVAEELAILKSRYAPDHIWFVDDIFGLKPGWISEFSRRVDLLDATVPFTIQCRADLISEDVVKSLSAVRCEAVWLGAESGSQKVLDAMKKGITIEQIHKARDLLGSYNIRACFFIQFGYPCETLEDIQSTIRLVRTAMPDDIGISVSYPLSGTEFYNQVFHELNGKRNWKESNDLDIMFKSRFESEYYRRLGTFLHRYLDTLHGRAGSYPTAGLAEVEAECGRLIADASSYQNGVSSTAA